MMKPLAGLWKALDEIPEATADRREWCLRLKNDWPAAEQFLSAIGHLVLEISCPSPGGEGCPRKVVQHVDGKIRAVCGNLPAECDAVDITREDITCLTLDRRKVARAICGILGAGHRLGPHGRSATLIGSHAVAAGLSIPIHLLIPGPLASATCNVMNSIEGPAAIVVPTPSSLPPGVQAGLKAMDHEILALSEISGVDPKGQLIGLRGPAAILSRLRAKLLAATTTTAPVRLWVLPPDARWEDLTFEFIAAQVLNIRFKSETRRFEPEHLGMKKRRNGKPTTAWTLLHSLARLGGRLTWADPSARTTIKKQKELLSQGLRDAFGIAEDPIVWSKTRSAYETRFTIRTSEPVERRSGARG